MNEEKLLYFSELNKLAKMGQILFAGSSLAENFPVNELLNSMDKRYIVYNRGISGDTTNGLIGTMEECIFELSPSKIFINIGTNDMNEQSYVEDILINNYKNILLKIRERLPQTKIYVLSYYPVNSGKTSSLTKEIKEVMFATRTNKAINHVNLRLIELAEELNCEYIDVHSILLDDVGNLDEKYTLEGIHLKPNAYNVVLNTIVKFF
jgi:lysophospholipase L1-like esterase